MLLSGLLLLALVAPTGAWTSVSGCHPVRLLSASYRPSYAPAEQRTRLYSSLQEDSRGVGVFDGLIKALTSETLSLSVGSLGLLALTINRLSTENLYDSQSRTDILGVIAAGGLLLNGLTLQDITARVAETVEVRGVRVDEVDPSLTPEQQKTLRWAADTFQQVFPTITSVVVSFNGKAVVRQGLAGPSGARYQELSILKKAVEEAVPESDGISPVTYIPDLQILPGRTEFTYLPDLCQSVVIQPFANNKGVLVLGGNQARNLNPKDLTRLRMVTQKVQASLAA